MIGQQHGLWRIYSMRRYIPLLDYGVNAQRASIAGSSVIYLGQFPEEKALMISSERCYLLPMERRALYLSALEASLSGFDIVTLALRGGLYSVLKGAEDGGGRVHAVSSEDLAVLERERMGKIQRILLTGGSLIVPDDPQAAAAIAVSLSSALISTGNGCVMSCALDSGLDCAVLRSSLARRSGRKAASEGAPVIDTFSSFLALPPAIAYPDVDGLYRFGDERFGIMRL